MTIGIAAAGDPRDRKTWSGTPKELIDAAERRGLKVLPFSGHKRSGQNDLLYVPSVLRYGIGAKRFRNYYGPFHRDNVKAFSDFRSQHKNTPVIHTDYMWLHPDLVGTNDYLYRDCGWSNWAKSRGLNKKLANSIGHEFRAILNKVEHIFTTSEWAKNELIGDGAKPEKVTVAGTGVGNLIRPYHGQKDYTNGMTLCVAKVRHHDKGLDLLLQGFALARERQPHLTLHLVVPPRSVRSAPGVHLYSDLPSSDLVNLYQRASVYAMPARNEPYGLVYLEAQLAGMALLGSAVGAFPEFVAQGRAGFIVRDLTPRAVSEALLEAHSDQERLRLMGFAGREQASSLSWDKTIKRIMDVVS